ncbi:putative membrane associated protein [Trypanosoma grayi]|uniref:putative membrane associated protein n=1 Tax=Trypanosoma grayi TaxID=71804 RepID=UPI0004F485BD|nr:putative membrane associated protein [Trypanosoma grayi]KEG11631.1 putative membrane associated protein [Trypanosoma grayi]
MTEYKKLCALVAQLREESTRMAQACEGGEENDALALHLLSESIQTLISNARPRLLKILRKAQETNPDRQIYNETMCGAIKGLFEDFCEGVSALFGQPMRDALISEDNINYEECPSLSWAANMYDQYMLNLARTEAWKKRLATSIADLVLFEEETRAVYSAEEKQARGTLLQAKKAEKADAIRLLEERETAKWEVELRRRGDEHKRLLGAANLSGGQSAEKALLDVPVSFRKLFAANMLQLARALRTSPEDPNIRHIRCNNVRVMTEYGHISLCSECLTCKAFQSCAEVLWYMMGYRVEYSSSPALSLRAVIERSQPITLPCGNNASEHAITLIGFEDYSERLFSLHEPDPTQEPNEWMTWYTTVEALAHCLEMYTG